MVPLSRLLRQWDPIGVFGNQSDWPEDKYEAYVSPIVAALKTGADEQTIRQQLEGIRTDHMGLQPSLSADADAARQICCAWAKLDAT